MDARPERLHVFWLGALDRPRGSGNREEGGGSSLVFQVFAALAKFIRELIVQGKRREPLARQPKTQLSAVRSGDRPGRWLGRNPSSDVLVPCKDFAAHRFVGEV